MGLAPRRLRSTMTSVGRAKGACGTRIRNNLLRIRYARRPSTRKARGSNFRHRGATSCWNNRMQQCIDVEHTGTRTNQSFLMGFTPALRNTTFGSKPCCLRVGLQLMLHQLVQHSSFGNVKIELSVSVLWKSKVSSVMGEVAVPWIGGCQGENDKRRILT